MIRANIMSVLESFVLDNPDEISKDIAKDFRKRRTEKAFSQREVAEKSKVPLATLRRFESTGRISLRSLVALAIALGYVSEISSVFREAKYRSIDELEQIKRNRDKRRARKSAEDKTLKK